MNKLKLLITLVLLISISCAVNIGKQQVHEVAKAPQQALYLSFEQEMGVHQYIYSMSIYGTDLTVAGVPMSPGDTLTAYCRGKLIGARLIEPCPNPDSCSYNILRYMPIYLNDPYDLLAIDCPAEGDIIDIKYNGIPVLSTPTVTWTFFGDHLFIEKFEYDPSCCTMRGDLNQSNSIDISDLIFLIDWMFIGGPPPLCLMNADVNANGITDISDLIYMIDYMFMGGPEPLPCNWWEVSFDATATDTFIEPTTGYKSVRLDWSAVGDDGYDGTASLYDLRISKHAMTAETFEQCSKVRCLSDPLPVGTPETIYMNLDTGTYHLAIKTADEIANWSGISNVVTVE